MFVDFLQIQITSLEYCDLSFYATTSPKCTKKFTFHKIIIYKSRHIVKAKGVTCVALAPNGALGDFFGGVVPKLNIWFCYCGPLWRVEPASCRGFNNSRKRF